MGIVKRVISTLLIFAFCGICLAREWWDKVPWEQWSEEQVSLILFKSPWVQPSTLFFIRGDRPARIGMHLEHPGGMDFKERYYVELLTARPVREAVLHDIVHHPQTSVTLRTVSLDELSLDPESAEQARLERLVESNPRNVIVKGDEEHIIISLRLVADPKFRRSLNYPYDLSGFDLAGLKDHSWLETDTGKRIQITAYEPPGFDALDVNMFIFKRSTPDGTPFISKGDKELRFETHLANRNIKVKFNLRKMMYKGRLEY